VLGLIKEKSVAKKGIRCRNCGQVNLIDKTICHHCERSDGLKGVKPTDYLDSAFKLKKEIYYTASTDTPDNNTIKNSIRSYKGNQSVSAKLFQEHAIEMAKKGYIPTSQNYQPGEWSGGAFLMAGLLCFILVGFLVFIYMLIVKPEGTLTVTYEYKEQVEKIEEKTCPQCAEIVKKAANMCRFCHYDFT